MPTAYSYIRFSSARQKLGASEARQEESPEPWCKANGYTLDTSLRLRDLGRSGYHGDHIKKGALGVFLDLVRDGKIERGSVMLIEHLDRLTRQDPFTGMETITEIIKAGIDIVTLMDGERYSRELLSHDFTLTLKLQFNLFQNHQESDKKSVRLTDVWKRKRDKVRSGERVTKRCPMWIDKDTGDVIEDRADLIRRVFKMALDDKGINAIARELNVEAIPPPGGGKKWSGTLVKYYLNNRGVLGEYQPCRQVEGRDIPEGDPIAGYYPPIVDRNTFLHVQRALQARKTTIRGRDSGTKNLFRGLLYSLYDGGRYTLKDDQDLRGTGHKLKKPISGNYRDGMPNSMTVSINYDPFEATFLRFVEELDVVSLFTPKDSTDKAKELETLQADLIEIEGKIRTTKERVKKTRDINALLDLIEELESDRNTIVRRIELLKSELITSQGRIWEDMKAVINDPESRGKIASALRLLVERINLLPIHIKTGRWKKGEYILYAEVVFNNGEVRCFVTDHVGVREHHPFKDGTGDDVYPPDFFLGVLGKAVMVHGGKWDTWGFSFVADQERRLWLIRQLIPYASEKWKPLLESRFG